MRWIYVFISLCFISCTSSSIELNQLYGTWLSQAYLDTLYSTNSISKARNQENLFFTDIQFLENNEIVLGHGPPLTKKLLDTTNFEFTTNPYPYWYPEVVDTYKIINLNKTMLVLRKNDSTNLQYIRSEFDCGAFCLSRYESEFENGKYELQIEDVSVDFEVLGGNIKGLKDFDYFSWQMDYVYALGNFDLITLRGTNKNLAFRVDSTYNEKLFLSILDDSNSARQQKAILTRK